MRLPVRVWTAVLLGLFGVSCAESSSASPIPQSLSLACIPAAGNVRSLIDQFALNAQSLLPRHFGIVCSLRRHYCDHNTTAPVASARS